MGYQEEKFSKEPILSIMESKVSDLKKKKLYRLRIVNISRLKWK